MNKLQDELTLLIMKQLTLLLNLHLTIFKTTLAIEEKIKKGKLEKNIKRFISG